MPDAAVQLHTLHSLILRAAALWVLLWLAACGPAPDAALSPPPGLPPAAAVADVPLIEQADFYCGPAALAMVMQWGGSAVDQGAIAEIAFTPAAKGTYRSDMIGAARRQGFLAVPVEGEGELMAEVAAGHPVIVFQDLGIAFAHVWHYGVVTAYDLDAGIVELHSGARQVMRMPLRNFRASWRKGDRWALVVLPAGELPHLADETRVLQAAAGLERAGQPEAAARAYAAGGGQWPENWIWAFGEGNALYASGQLEAARDTFLRARRMAPDVPEIAANLAETRRALRGG